MREFANIEVMLPTWSWKPTYYVYSHTTKKKDPGEPVVSMREAIEIAREASSMPAATVTAAELSYWGRGLEWIVVLDKRPRSPPTRWVGGALPSTWMRRPAK